jgi:hypothetical protein
LTCIDTFLRFVDVFWTVLTPLQALRAFLNPILDIPFTSSEPAVQKHQIN